MFRDKYKNNNYYIKKLEIKDFDLLYNIGRNPLIWEQHPETNRWKEEKFKIYFDRGIQNKFGIYGVFDTKKIKLLVLQGSMNMIITIHTLKLVILF